MKQIMLPIDRGTHQFSIQLLHRKLYLLMPSKIGKSFFYKNDSIGKCWNRLN
jgi:hypothetical protein